MDKFFTFRLPKRWVKIGLVMAVIATLAAPGIGIASHTFIDVPDTNTHHDNITWLANAGVTEGCNPPANDMYCPSDPVTRAQMATFMRRLAENRVVDADTLDGWHGSYYENPLWGTDIAGEDADPLTSANTTWVEYTVDAPRGGWLLVNATVSITDTTSSAKGLFWVQVDDTTCSNTGTSVQSVAYGYVTVGSTTDFQSAAMTGVASVGSGSHTVTLCGREFGAGGGDTVVYGQSLSTLFSAQGVANALPAGSPVGAVLPGTTEG